MSDPSPPQGENNRWDFGNIVRRLLERLSSSPDHEPRTPFLPYTTEESSRSRAEERRASLRATLADVGDAGFLRREFLEIPPGMDNVRQRPLADTPNEAFGQMARLRWQLNSDELLLVERLVDAIVILKRQDETQNQQRPEVASNENYPLVKLEPLEIAAQSDDLFPWKAVIETSEPEYYRQRLTPLQNWLGIGIDFAPRREIRLTGRCTVGDGLEGVTGGLVEDHDLYAVTCAHVLSADCKSMIIKGNPYAAAPTGAINEPDAALIDIHTPCFIIPIGIKRRRVSCADDQIVLTSVNNRVKVSKSNSRPKEIRGLIYNQVALLPPSNHGGAYRFPHVEIRPHRTAYIFGLLKYPLGKSRFSKEGDSGSWVIEESLGIWFGMVIAGNDLGVTYAAEGQPLLDFFEQQLQSRRSAGKVAKLIPYTLS